MGTDGVLERSWLRIGGSCGSCRITGDLMFPRDIVKEVYGQRTQLDVTLTCKNISRHERALDIAI